MVDMVHMLLDSTSDESSVGLSMKCHKAAAEISRLRKAIANHRDSPGEADDIDRQLWDGLPSGY